jgi:hypothetical protein
MSDGVMLLACAVLFLCLGVVVGAWVRGLIQPDSAPHVGQTPPGAAVAPPPTSTPPPLPPPVDPPPSHLIDLCAGADCGGTPLKTVRVRRRSHRVFYADQAWDHFGQTAEGRWQYHPHWSLTARQQRAIQERT